MASLIIGYLAAMYRFLFKTHLVSPWDRRLLPDPLDYLPYGWIFLISTALTILTMILKIPIISGFAVYAFSLSCVLGPRKAIRQLLYKYKDSKYFPGMVFEDSDDQKTT